LLTRLPARPLDILASLLPNDLNASVLADYLVHSSHQTTTSDCTLTSPWDYLQVVALVNTVNLRVALGIAWAIQNWGRTKQGWVREDFVDASAALLRLAFQLSAETVDADEKRSWVVVKAFLWTSLQRVLMLYLWTHLDDHLQTGFSFDNQGMNIRALDSISEISIQLTLQELDDKKKAPYMCSWAYELLRNDRAAVTADLRRFHWCYCRLFGDRPARCKAGQQQCEGNSPQNCQRFKGAVVLDQSAHDSECNQSCKRLFWDRASFVNVSGATAVCIKTTDERYLRYCKASDKTLAISHVWSHGQGGRPDTTGFNACLHRRYTKLALYFKCDSYWMDTPCIPNEKALRAECIDFINKIFAQSMVTLVCDRDIMSVDISSLTMDLRESILATVLVCDWNVRAWTLLEAMRGRHNIYLLCKGDKVLSFRETLKTVSEKGRIDLAILFLTTQHLLPTEQIDDFEILGMKMVTPKDTMKQRGFISLGEASVLLSHRHATRDGDDVVIWSLLANETAIKNVAELWKSQVGFEVNTGFLMSNSPRLEGYSGLGWAPSCPSLQSPPRTDSKIYLAYDGVNSQMGLITSEGFQAKWLIHKFLMSSTDCDMRFPRNVKIARQSLQNYRWGALLRPGQRNPPSVPAPYQGKAKEPLLAICGSNDGRCWEWKGVYEWDSSDPLPNIFPDLKRDFLLEKVLLV